MCNLVVVLYRHLDLEPFLFHKIKSHFLPSLVTSRVPLRSKFKNVENLKNTDFDGIFKFPEFCFLSLVGHVKLLKRAKNDVRFQGKKNLLHKILNYFSHLLFAPWFECQNESPSVKRAFSNRGIYFKDHMKAVPPFYYKNTGPQDKVCCSKWT